MQPSNFLPTSVLLYSLSKQTISDGSVALAGLQALSHGEPGVVRSAEASLRRPNTVHLETVLLLKPEGPILS
jgi:hypothetical protein